MFVCYSNKIKKNKQTKKDFPRLMSVPFWIVERAHEMSQRKNRKRELSTAQRSWSEGEKREESGGVANFMYFFLAFIKIHQLAMKWVA